MEPRTAQKKSGRLILEADELWSFVGSKAAVRWVWAALDADTRQVVALIVGDRSDFTAECLWLSLPDEYRDGATVHTDVLAAYRMVTPRGQHAPGGKGDGLTNHIERFWCTLRQRCGRLVRKALSFSKCDRNHIGAIWYFVRHYNKSRL